MSVQTQTQREVFYTAKIREPNGHRAVFLEGLTSSMTVADLRAQAMSALRLSTEVDWNLRQDQSGRLLQDDQRLDEVAGSQTQITVTMQPDAGLG